MHKCRGRRGGRRPGDSLILRFSALASCVALPHTSVYASALASCVALPHTSVYASALASCVALPHTCIYASALAPRSPNSTSVCWQARSGILATPHWASRQILRCSGSSNGNKRTYTLRQYSNIGTNRIINVTPSILRASYALQ